MKRHLVVTAVVFVALIAFVGFNLLTSETAHAQSTEGCVQSPTIASLEACVEQMAEQGFINNQGVTSSLLAKLDAAQEALDRGQTPVAIQKLNAFIHEVQAQAGKHIDPMHAQHIVMHAQMVIQSLEK